jgi:hypothetical protein
MPITQVYMQVLTVIFQTGISYLRLSDRAGLIYRKGELKTVNNVEKQNLVLELHDERYM